MGFGSAGFQHIAKSFGWRCEIYIYIYIYIYLNIYIYKYIYIFIYIYKYIYIYLYFCLFIYIFIYIYIYLFKYIYIYFYLFIYICMYVWGLFGDDDRKWHFLQHGSRMSWVESQDCQGLIIQVLLMLREPDRIRYKNPAGPGICCRSWVSLVSSQSWSLAMGLESSNPQFSADFRVHPRWFFFFFFFSAGGFQKFHHMRTMISVHHIRIVQPLNVQPHNAPTSLKRFNALVSLPGLVQHMGHKTKKCNESGSNISRVNCQKME